MPLTGSTALARRIDHTELAMGLGMAEHVRAQGRPVQVWPVGGTAAVLAAPDSPFNKLIGLGFGAPIDPAELAIIERAHAEQHVRLQAEVSTLADPGVSRLLTERGYLLIGFENVLARRLGEADVQALRDPAFEIAAVEGAASTTWIRAVTDAFLHPDVFDGPSSHESFDGAVLERTFEDVAAVPGMSRLLARIDGAVAGGAALYVRDQTALLCGAATVPAFRRRGVQSALLHARLAQAHAAGCDLAIVTTQPGSKSQQNVQRAGFELIYSRAVLVKEN